MGTAIDKNTTLTPPSFVKRRDHSQEYTLIVHLLRFCHLRRDYILCNRGTR